MSERRQNINLSDATNRFLTSLSAEKRSSSQPEIFRFIRWFGRERTLSELTAAEIANYADRLSTSDTDYNKKLELIRNFLVYAKKEGWSQTNLAVHLKARKGKIRLQPSVRRDSKESMVLTEQGYNELKIELETLKCKRSEVIDEIRKAAADKDFRENVPLQAAREERGHLEGRIMELEEILKSSIIINEKEKPAFKISIGDKVALSDLNTGEELHYILVNPREVDPASGKISSASPIGKAVIGRGEGEVVEITVPAGKLQYQIKRIDH